MPDELCFPKNYHKWDFKRGLGPSDDLWMGLRGEIDSIQNGMRYRPPIRELSMLSVVARRLVDRNLLLTRNLDGFISSILKWRPLIDIWAMLTRIIYRIGFGGLYEVWQGRLLFVFEDKFDTVMNRGRRITQCNHKLLYS